MQEAIMLQRVLEGGPSGPGTGSGTGTGNQSPSVSSSDEHTHITSGGPITHTHDFPPGQSIGPRFNPNRFGVRNPGFPVPAVGSMDPRFPPGQGLGFPGFGGRTFNWPSRGRFTPISGFPPEQVTLQPMFPGGQVIGTRFQPNTISGGLFPDEQRGPLVQPVQQNDHVFPPNTIQTFPDGHFDTDRGPIPFSGTSSRRFPPIQQLPVQQPPIPQPPIQQLPIQQPPVQQPPIRRPPQRRPPAGHRPHTGTGESLPEVALNNRITRQNPAWSGGNPNINSGNGNRNTGSGNGVTRSIVVTTLVPPVIRPERQGQVSDILQDEGGPHYMFFPRVNGVGIRVNITKPGFCRRNPQTRERNFCMNMCYSDRQCPRQLKCCPSGCSLSCIDPTIE